MPTHGSLTKAGKVRNTTPKIEGKPRRKSTPKSRNRKNYYKRFILEEKGLKKKKRKRRRR